MASLRGLLASTVSSVGQALHRFGTSLSVADKQTFDAAESSPRRRAPETRLLSEDDDLTPERRRAVVATARDLRHNFAIASWAVRKHLDYVASFSLQFRTKDQDFNREAERQMGAWAEPDPWNAGGEHCDAMGRHPLRRIIRLMEALRTIDGDAFLIRVAPYRLQMIEGDLCRDPYGTSAILPAGYRYTHGMQLDASGRTTGYVFCRRTGYGGFAFERIVPKSNVFQHGYFERADQLRGISPFSSAINSYRDVYETIEYASARAKIAQLFGVKFTRTNPVGGVDAWTGTPPVTTGDDTAGDDTAPAEPRYDVPLGKGPFSLDLDPGDNMEFLESHQPAMETQEFLKLLIGIALKALDIPLSFYDEAHSTYSGSRQAWIQYDQSAESKRADNRLLLNSITRWRVAGMIATGQLRVPKSWTLDDLAWEWIATGVPWIDPLKEVQADIAAINAGLDSRTSRLKAQGREFRDVVDELAEEKRLLETAGLSIPPPIPVHLTELTQGA